MASEKILNAGKNNFEEEILNSQMPVLVDFWAQWCGPCRAVGPIMEELADEFDGKARIAKVNVDEEGELAAKYRVMSIPTVMLFKDGQMVEKVIGARSKNEFSNLISKNI